MLPFTNFTKRVPFRKMGFVVDRVSEDSFYENLLLGLSRVLEKSPYISNTNLNRHQGLKQIEIRNWEHNNGINLPENLKSFYSSTNGFLYVYEFAYQDDLQEGGRGTVRVGKIEINPLNDVARIYGYETKNIASIEKIGEKHKLVLSKDSKVFELCNVDDNAKVVLVYTNAFESPTIWLYTNSMLFNFLASDFTTYFRMCIAHLGIPCWQYKVSKEGLPEWVKEIFTLLAPGVLDEDRNLIEIPKVNMEEINKIDPSIFLNPTAHGSTTHLHTLHQTKSKEKKIKANPKKQPSGRITRNVK